MRSVLKSYVAALLAASLSLATASMASATDLLERIKEKGEIVIASEARYPPFEFVENGQVVGYGVDLFDEVMKALPGVKVTRLDLPFQGLLPGLQTKKFDAIITAVTVNKQRYEAYRLSLPIADASFSYVKRKGDTSLNSPDDLSGKIVGTQAGSAQLKGTEAFSQQLEAKGLEPIADIQTYVDFNEAYADLAAGRTDAVVNSLPNLLYLQTQRGDVFETVKTTFGAPTYFSWAFRKDDDSKALADFVDDQFRKLSDDGTMARLQEKWFGFTMELPTDALPVPQE
ncbi:transporter substrate-binding domain-containing protein [Aquibium sp. A9E412]|uniref:transporter substrate-binding domain-containing protein n=1 Tax=Aquibium sp. A9E412 TaxID=2976767 RepID=UPI0025B0426F|nr:transporter substrate-binding domain-containing protein [Aquibium sp. A9E412]MDN2565766.1 transporter substrate-binding domain-containing protein [Aquibium sp. A9E412]